MYFGIWITLLLCTFLTYKAAFIGTSAASMPP